MLSPASGAGVCISIPDDPTVQRPNPHGNAHDFSETERTPAFHNHGFQQAALQFPITPAPLNDTTIQPTGK